jgi:ABC-type Co2+ transport system, permease component
LQLFLLHFGGISSLGANVFILSVPAMILGTILRRHLATSAKMAFLCGFAAGFLVIAGSVLLLGITLIQSNMRFGSGPFSTVSAVTLAHLPLMFIEGLVTGFAVQFIVKTRPNFFGYESTHTERLENEK